MTHLSQRLQPKKTFIAEESLFCTRATRTNRTTRNSLKPEPGSEPLALLTWGQKLNRVSFSRYKKSFRSTASFKLQIQGSQKQDTVEPRHNDVPRDWQNYIVISGYRFNRIPDITMLKKNNQNYRYIGVFFFHVQQ